MAGKKGRSGRKSNGYNKAVEKVTDEKIVPILLSSALAVQRFFDSDEVTIQEKAELGSRFLLKIMPQKIEGQIGGASPIFQIIIDKKESEGLKNNRLLESGINAI